MGEISFTTESLSQHFFGSLFSKNTTHTPTQ